MLLELGNSAKSKNEYSFWVFFAKRIDSLFAHCLKNTQKISFDIWRENSNIYFKVKVPRFARNVVCNETF